MGARAILSAMTTVVLLTQAGSLNGSQALTVQVTPKVAPAPGWVRVSALVEASDDNRSLEVTASSDQFTRASSVQLDGSRAPRLTVLDYSNLPAGVYEVSTVLVGSNGTRAAVSRYVQIIPMPGQR